MLDSVFEIVYFIGLIVGSFIRRMQHSGSKKSRAVENREDRLGKVYLFVQLFGMILLPLVYLFSPVLDFADYALPVWAGSAGVLIFIAPPLILIKAHKDLGLNWSSRLRIRDQHEMVSDGIYSYIRHPMYAAHWIWGIAQVLLLQNWIVGPATLYTYLPFYLHRVPREEQMMLDRFGEQYRSYMKKTGRIIPSLKSLRQR